MFFDMFDRLRFSREWEVIINGEKSLVTKIFRRILLETSFFVVDICNVEQFEITNI